MKISVTQELPDIMLEVDENHPLIDTLYENMPKKEQYWRRDTDFPQWFYDYDPHLPDSKVCRINASRTEYKHGKLVTLSVDDTIELVRLVNREYVRMRYGVFIMNNGKKIYFPGFYYGALQWGKMFGVSKNNGYGEHRAYQRIFACARQLAIVNDYLDGYYCHKAKKTGITQLISLFFMTEHITHRQFTTAAMSKTHDTCKKANFKYFMYAFKNLPPVLRPKIEGRWQSQVQKLEMRTSIPEYSVENTMAAVTTTTDGLDGLPIIQRVHIDEPPKMPKDVPISEVYLKSKEQVRLQQVKRGIMEMTSYPPEEDTDAFKWCRRFYEECRKVNKENGLPINRMLPIFISIVESSSGTFDIYGEPDRIKALTEEKAARAILKTDAEKQARNRQYPITAAEGWRSGGGGSVYNNIVISEQIAILEEQYAFGQLNYMEGNLEWTGEKFNSPVKFTPLTMQDILAGKTGKWKIYCTMEYLQNNTNLCFKMKRKVKMKGRDRFELLQPPDFVIHCAGIDPVDYAFVSEVGQKPSQNASVVKTLSGDLLSVYHHRDEDPDVALEDFCLEMIFWSYYGIVEGNRKQAVTTLEKLGMHYFILVRHPNGQILPYKQNMSIKHVSSGKDMISKYILLVYKRTVTQTFKYKSLPVLKQLADFESDDTQKYDLGVADGLCEVAIESMEEWMRSKKVEHDKYKDMQKVLGRVA